MPSLDTLLAERPSLTLDELTDAANELMPAFLPDEPVDSRVSETVNARLIRHYVSEGVLDGAVRDGRKAVYSVDHLLQLLALRRLLADGVSASTIGTALTRLHRDELRAIAEGSAGTEVFPISTSDPHGLGSDPSDRRARAAAALSEIRSRSGGRTAPSAGPDASTITSFAFRGPQPASTPRPAGASDVSDEPSRWERLPILDGVELHVRSDVRLPSSPAAQQKLLDHVIRQIVLYAQRRGS